ncbi:ABC transporter substrate-binding protein [Cobetia amphilecti]|uniref:ABC transporter substrate-binding protein n=1 Tax=Cobetia amphilecti TaxID=1055104 RepID=UPI001C09A389|nr:ABC transporter substrate-binding protein [Cobetia amphilecti]
MKSSTLSLTKSALKTASALSLRTGLALSSVALLSSAFIAPAQAGDESVELVVQYAYGSTFNPAMERLKSEFEQANPDISIRYRAPYESYEEGSQKVMRESIIKRMPDISLQGLNQVRSLASREIAVDLTAFIESETDFAAAGYRGPMLDLGRFDGGVYSLPYAVSLPIAYYNTELMEKAGWQGDALPGDWDEVLKVASDIRALPEASNGLYYEWDITGNWLFQAPVFARGGQMTRNGEQEVAFNDDSGRFALKTLSRMVTDAGMSNMGWQSAYASFAAGNTGILITSVGSLQSLSDQIGDKFTLKTGPFPGVQPQGGLPAGGTAMVMLARDADKQQAAWRFMKFATQGEGAIIVAEETGYAPPNQKVNEEQLSDFYTRHPNRAVMVQQLPLMRPWYAFPGANGLKITDIIKNHMESIVTGKRAGESDAVLAEMAEEVQALLPH